MDKERLNYCRYYDDKGEPPLDHDRFDEYYFAKAEQFFVEQAGSEREQETHIYLHICEFFTTFARVILQERNNYHALST